MPVKNSAVNNVIRTQKEISELHQQAVDADTPEGNVVATTIDWLLDKEAVNPLDATEEDEEEGDFDDEDIEGDIEEEIEEEEHKK